MSEPVSEAGVEQLAETIRRGILNIKGSGDKAAAALDALLAGYARLEQERDGYAAQAAQGMSGVAVAEWKHRAGAAEARLAEVERGIDKLQRIADEAWEEADNEDDCGGHVGIARYYREKGRHFGEAAAIARASAGAADSEETAK